MLEDIIIAIGVFVVVPIICGLFAKFIMWLITEDNLRAAKARDMLLEESVCIEKKRS